MEAEDCLFSLLPLQFRDSFLFQAFRQLDQQQQLQVLPLVCKDFHQLAPKAANSISIVLRSNEAASCFAFWILQHQPASLHTVSIIFEDCPGSSRSSADEATGLALDTRGAEQVLCAVTQLPALENLGIYGWERGERLSLEITSSSVPRQLRALHIANCAIMPSMASSIVQFTGLTYLVLLGSDVKSESHDGSDEGFIPTVATSLCHLESLGLLGKEVVSVTELRCLTALTSLQKLWLSSPIKAAELDQVLCLPLGDLAVTLRAPSDLNHLARWLDASGSGLRGLMVEAFDMMEAAVAQQLFVSVRKSAPTLQNLFLVRFELFGVEMMAPLCNLRQLEALRVNGSSFDSAAVSAMSALTSLRLLQLRGSHWGSTESEGFGLARLSCLPKLQKLNVLGPTGVLEECRLAWAGRILEEMDDGVGVCFKLLPP